VLNYNKHELRCVLIISVGRPEHEGRKLYSAIKFINNHFSYCDVAICDTLQRHTISMFNDISDEKSLFMSEQQGIDWFLRNQQILNEIKIDHDFLCWDEWLRDKEFEECKTKILKICESDPHFKKSLDSTISIFLNRAKKKAGQSFCFDRAYSYCHDYLVEESAVMMLIWPRKLYHNIVYPHAIPLVLGEVHKHFVLPKHPDLLHWLEIKFEKRGLNSPFYKKTGIKYENEEIIDDLKVSCVNS